MGDAGVLAFNSIKDKLPKNIDILKLGHHGAEGSIDQNMLDKISPKYSIISVGYNKYNHPSFDVIDLLSKNNVEILSTKELGAIKMVIEKEDFRIYHFMNSKFNKL